MRKINAKMLSIIMLILSIITFALIGTREAIAGPTIGDPAADDIGISLDP